MANTFKKIVDAVTGRFSLAEIPNFPYEIYTSQLAVYNECENWFKGYALQDEGSVSGNASATDLYPLHINPIQATCLKHAYMLFGEVEHDGRPLVYPKLIPLDLKSKESMDDAQVAEEALSYVWWENNGRALMMENGVLSQIYGGCVFKATFVPWEAKEFGGWRNIPIRIERVSPKSFIGRPDAGDMYRLKEAWIVSDISLDEAQKWGYTGYDESPTFVEYWSRKEHKTWINDSPVTFPIAEPDPKSKDNPFNGANPFGFVPIVYIPHVRAGDFHGTNAFDHLKGMVKEMNLRFGDYGDAVNDDSHIPLAIRNVTGSPQVRKIANGLTVLDLGGTTNITGSESEPDVFEVRKIKASAAMKDLLEEILSQYRRDSFVPAVADGEDEGSQRSALTLATRFWPLTSHVGIERIFFGAGLDVFQSYLLKMMQIKGLGKIEEKHTQMRMVQSWAPMLPRDREAEVQEWTSRAQNNIGSMEHLLELTRDVDDVADEREKILAWIKDVTKIQVDAAAEAAQKYPAPSPFGGGATNATAKKSNQDKKIEKTPTEKVGGGGGKK